MSKKLAPIFSPKNLNPGGLKSWWFGNLGYPAAPLPCKKGGHEALNVHRFLSTLNESYILIHKSSVHFDSKKVCILKFNKGAYFDSKKVCILTNSTD